MVQHAWTSPAPSDNAPRNAARAINEFRKPWEEISIFTTKAAIPYDETLVSG